MSHSLLVAQNLDQFTQLQQLEMMRQLQEKMGGEQLPSQIAEGKELQQQELQQEIVSDEELTKEEVIVEKFGYSGGEDYITSPQSKFLKAPLESFGYDYFNAAPSNLDKDIPIPSDHILGPGDEIWINMYGATNNRFLRKVGRDGNIFYPDVGPISVVGLTFQEMKEAISLIVENQFYDTKVMITLGSLRSMNIFVLGEANQPGMFTVSSLSSLTNTIFSAGGIKDTGSLRNIQVKRRGKVISSFDFYNLLLKGDTRDDIYLQTGDVIFIPPATKKVAISGEVSRPGIYELKEGESVQELINYAGKFKPKADLNSIEIERINHSSGNGFTLINVDLNSVSSSSFDLNNGDVLHVYPIINNMQGTVLVKGYAQRAGFYPWKEGMRMSDLFSFSEDILPMTDKSYVLVKRQNKTNGLYLTLQVDLEELFLKNDSDKDIFLQEKDEIILFPILLAATKSAKPTETDEDFTETDENSTETDEDFTETDEEEGDPTALVRMELIEPILRILERQASPTEQQKTVMIVGNTFFPGVYPLTIGMTLGDAIKASGGLKDTTYTADIELIRSNIDGKHKKSFDINITGLDVAVLNSNLEPGDIINIKQITRSFHTANILGEVYFPGSYPVSENETILSLIQRAGGLKDTAYLKGSLFQRESLKGFELERLKKLREEAKRNMMLSARNVGQEQVMDMATLNAILEDDFIDETEMLGRLVIDLNSIIEGTSENLILEDGDQLMIPKMRQVVSVIGEVFVPNSHIFQTGLSMQDYINLSGGPTEFADGKNSYLIKADGSIINQSQSSNRRFFRASANELIEPGDTVVLPLRVDQFNALRATSEITQIIYQMALATAAVNSF